MSRRFPRIPIAAKRPPRASYLSVDEQRLLHDWGASLRRMFPTNISVLHVGSSINSPTYRDVDVRIILPDDDYAAITERIHRLDLNLSLTLWGKAITGLPIDCQIQALHDPTVTQRQMRRPIGRGMEIDPERLTSSTVRRPRSAPKK